MIATLRSVLGFLRQVYDKFGADGCARTGAALAYYSLFSLFPLLLLFVSVLGYLLAFGVPILVDARTYVLDSAGNTFPQARELLERSIDSALKARGATGLVGLLTLLWSASNVFTQLYQALNQIWGSCPAPTIRAAVRTKLTAIAVVLGIGFLLMLSMVFNAALGVALRYAEALPAWHQVWQSLGPLSSAGMATLIFGLLYHYLPNTEVRWRHVWPGALLAGAAWELLRQAFTIYATRTNYAAVYGAVGSTIALLSWIYLSAQVLLFGAEFSVVYARRQARSPSPQSPPPLRRAAMARLRQGWLGFWMGTVVGGLGLLASIVVVIAGAAQGVRRLLGEPRQERDMSSRGVAHAPLGSRDRRAGGVGGPGAPVG